MRFQIFKITEKAPDFGAFFMTKKCWPYPMLSSQYKFQTPNSQLHKKPPIFTNAIMDLKKFRITASRKKKSLSAFLAKLDKLVPDDMPVLVKEADAEVWKKIDCTECANCCKTMTPTFTPKDLKRISAHLEMTPKEFKDKWLLKEEDSGDWVNKTQPCQFLADNMCSIYEVRPADCAEFPHHNKKPFDLYNDTFTNNLVHCPATLELVDSLKKRIEKDYVW